MQEVIWKPIPEWEGYYEISNYGLVKSLERQYQCGKSMINKSMGILRPKLDGDCYLTVVLTKPGIRDEYKIQQLVAPVFVLNPLNSPVIHHINRIRWDNRAENLAWVTQSENVQDSFDCGNRITRGAPVNKLDLSGNFIKRYEAMRHVEKDGFSSRAVNKVVLGQQNKHKDFRWEYADKELT